MSIQELAHAAKEEADEVMEKVEAANRALRRSVAHIKPPPIPKEWRRPEKAVAEEVAALKDMASKKVIHAAE